MVYVKCMLVIGLMPWKPFACIISENIDPRYLGLYVHHRMLYYTKTQQWYQSHGCFLLYLMQMYFFQVDEKKEKKT